MMNESNKRSAIGPAEAKSVVRVCALLAAIAGGVLMQDGLAGDTEPLFAIGLVFFAFALLAVRAPSLFWVPRARAARAPDQTEPGSALAPNPRRDR